MNTISKPAVCFLLMLFSVLVRAQDVSTPGGYMTVISEKIKNINQTYINYLSAVSHGKSARKVEKLRQKTVDDIFNARAEVMGTGGYKGDKTLRDATAAYLKTCYLVFNEDYGKIVNMEEIAEQSYDAMEAYLLAQSKAGEKLAEAADARAKAQTDFAAKYNVQLINVKDELDLKVEQSDKVQSYYNKVYLIFFKPYKQDAYLVDAMNRNDINGVEQNRNALATYANAGLEELAKVDAFESDASLVAACKKALSFYKELAEKKIVGVTDFMLATENFNKIKKSFEATPASKRTQADVDKFNKAVNDINVGAKNFNKTNDEVNKERNDVLNQWNNMVTRFMDVHMPYRK
jgi:hypothetical protein